MCSEMDERIKKIMDAVVGDILVLSDYNAMESGGEIEAVVTNVDTYVLPSTDLTIKCIGFDFNDEPMMVVVKAVGDEYEMRGFKEWSDGKYRDFFEGVEGTYKDDVCLPDSFQLMVCDDAGFDTYTAIDPFPLYGFTLNGRVQCGIGDYHITTPDVEIDETYWANYALLVWYVDGDSQDMLENYHALWLGWDLGVNEVELLK